MVLKRCQCCINDPAVHHFMNRLNRYQLRKQVLTHSGSTWQNVGGFVTNSTRTVSLVMAALGSLPNSCTSLLSVRKQLKVALIDSARAFVQLQHSQRYIHNTPTKTINTNGRLH